MQRRLPPIALTARPAREGDWEVVRDDGRIVASGLTEDEARQRADAGKTRR